MTINIDSFAARKQDCISVGPEIVSKLLVLSLVVHRLEKLSLKPHGWNGNEAHPRSSPLFTIRHHASSYPPEQTV